MTIADDFAIMLADLGVTVSRTPVTTTTDFHGQKTYTDGSAANVTAIFTNTHKKYPLDKPGLTEAFDAKILVVGTETINKYDKITYDSRSYRVDKVNKRERDGVVGFLSVGLFLIT